MIEPWNIKNFISIDQEFSKRFSVELNKNCAKFQINHLNNFKSSYRILSPLVHQGLCITVIYIVTVQKEIFKYFVFEKKKKKIAWSKISP